jgi:hypothetical protein
MAIQNVTRMPGATGNAGCSAGALITGMTVTTGRSYRFDRRQSFSKTFAAMSILTADSGFAGLVNSVSRYKRLRVLLLP